MPHGKICYVEIHASNVEDSSAFYRGVFGWTVRTRGDGALAFDDTGCVSGSWVKDGGKNANPRARVYIMVDDIAATLGRIEASGGRVLTPRTDIAPGSGAFAVFADPAGAEFGLYEEPKH
ncbi:MAG TPA: VOC family protein [Candidatus Polarisedimenticolia bacterium]|jgi:predicted enzyme related to lactoylglutathione lyase|nr:VOC family protein [Candidatus Polarisedimenticolia bacterium]